MEFNGWLGKQVKAEWRGILSLTELGAEWLRLKGEISLLKFIFSEYLRKCLKLNQLIWKSTLSKYEWFANVFFWIVLDLAPLQYHEIFGVKLSILKGLIPEVLT